MIFDGMNFKEVSTVVRIPSDSNYIIFGKVCHREANGAIRTFYLHTTNCRFGRKGEFVYAKPIPITGYSLTNMAYGKPFYRNRCNNGFREWYQNVYLMKDGRIYSALRMVSKDVYDRGQKVAYIPNMSTPERKP